MHHSSFQNTGRIRKAGNIDASVHASRLLSRSSRIDTPRVENESVHDDLFDFSKHNAFPDRYSDLKYINSNRFSYNYSNNSKRVSQRPKSKIHHNEISDDSDGELIDLSSHVAVNRRNNNEEASGLFTDRSLRHSSTDFGHPTEPPGYVDHDFIARANNRLAKSAVVSKRQINSRDENGPLSSKIQNIKRRSVESIESIESLPIAGVHPKGNSNRKDGSSGEKIMKEEKNRGKVNPKFSLTVDDNRDKRKSGKDKENRKQEEERERQKNKGKNKGEEEDDTDQKGDDFFRSKERRKSWSKKEKEKQEEERKQKQQNNKDKENNNNKKNKEEDEESIDTVINDFSHEYFQTFKFDVVRFIQNAPPIDTWIRCKLKINRGFFNTYTMYLEHTDTKTDLPLMTSKAKKVSAKIFHWVFVFDEASRNDEKKQQSKEKLVKFGKMYSNVSRSKFKLIGNLNEGDVEEDENDENSDLKLYFQLEYNEKLNGKNKPKDLNINLLINDEKAIKPFYSNSEEDDSHKKKELKRKGSSVSKMSQRRGKYVDLITKKPEWDPDLKTFNLDFRGRAEEPSTNNLQIVDESDLKNVLLQLGKVNSKLYYLDYKYPFNAFSAFGLSLSCLSRT